MSIILFQTIIFAFDKRILLKGLITTLEKTLETKCIKNKGITALYIKSVRMKTGFNNRIDHRIEFLMVPLKLMNET